MCISVKPITDSSRGSDFPKAILETCIFQEEKSLEGYNIILAN